MASNADLKATITEECETRKIDVPSFEGSTNISLVTMLKNIRAGNPAEGEAETETAAEKEARLAQEAADDEADEADEAQEKADKLKKKATAEKAKTPKYPFYVAPGQSITCKKGTLDAGDEVKAKYFVNGKDDLDVHVERGTVIER